MLSLLTLPRRREIAEARFQQAQVQAVEAVLRTAAYYRAVAANEVAKALEDARLSAEAIADLSQQLGETAALSKLD